MSFQVVSRFTKYIDFLMKKYRLAVVYPGNYVGWEGLGKDSHNCYAKIMSPKGRTYTKYLLVAS